MIGPVFGLLQLMVLVGLVVWVVRAMRSGSGANGGDTQTLRRVVLYGGLLVCLAVAAFGVSRLLVVAFPQEVLAGDQTEELALGLALTAVFTPAGLLLWRVVLRALRADPGERDTPAWSLYLVVATTGSLITLVVNLVQLGDVLVGSSPFVGDTAALAVVAAAVWGAHSSLLRHPTLGPTSELTRLAVMAASLIGLLTSAVGIGGLLRAGFEELYRTAVPSVLLARDPDLLGHSAVLVVIGVLVWWWYWWRQVRSGPADTLWLAYVLIIGVLGGLATAVAAVGVLLWTTLTWLLGDPNAATAAAHFAVLPPGLAAAAVGLGGWWLHREALDAVGTGARTEPERAYDHLAAGMGLVTAAIGVTITVMASLQALVPGAIAASDPTGRELLVLAITLLAVGTPVWWHFWHRVQRHVRAEAGAELASPSRRVYLLLLFGATGATAVFSLAGIAFVVLRDLLEGSLEVTVLHELRVAVGLVLTAGAVSAYHWAVHRDDRALAPPTPELERVREVLLVSPDGRSLATAVATETGARVRSLHRLDGPPLDIDPHVIGEAVRSVHHRRVLVTIDDDGSVHVTPYEPL